MSSEPKPKQFWQKAQENFTIEDLTVFDARTLTEMLDRASFGLSARKLAQALHGVERQVINNIQAKLPARYKQDFRQWLKTPLNWRQVLSHRQQLLKNLFWELTYWKTPELYEALTEGEAIHPGIFTRLKTHLAGKIVLDAGAGSGRSTLECCKRGAKKVYAVDPSPGLMRILNQKIAAHFLHDKVEVREGRFENIPLPDDSVDTALACSAFTAEAGQGGAAGLAELERVTRSGGKIVIIWPRPQDRNWLQERGFEYVNLGQGRKMTVRFRNFETARQCILRFYKKSQQALHYLHKQSAKAAPEIPFEVLGYNPPTDFCWKTVQK